MTGIPVIIKVIKDTRKNPAWQLKPVFYGFLRWQKLHGGLFYHKMNEREKVCIFMKIIIKLD